MCALWDLRQLLMLPLAEQFQLEMVWSTALGALVLAVFPRVASKTARATLGSTRIQKVKAALLRLWLSARMFCYVLTAACRLTHHSGVASHHYQHQHQHRPQGRPQCRRQHRCQRLCLLLHQCQIQYPPSRRATGPTIGRRLQGLLFASTCQMATTHVFEATT